MDDYSRSKESLNPNAAPTQEVEESRFSVPPPSDVEYGEEILDLPLLSRLLDSDAVRAVTRLRRYDFEAYLVGGCVRDILLGREPKDFDIVTSARPREIKELFRNCRLIGRRFRLAHLLYTGGKILEVATFRRYAGDDDDVSGRHAAENLFGGPLDDAIRRDFTINALFYDIQNRQIHDYVGGVRDIDTRTLRTIGNPGRRFREDPVRIIRAIRFSQKLDLFIESSVAEAMHECAALISTCPPARLVEELLKVLRSGCAAKCMAELHRFGSLHAMLPGLVSAVDEEGPAAFDLLAGADLRIQNGAKLSDSFLLCCLLYPHCREVLESDGDVALALEERLAALIQPLSFTKRNMGRLRHVFLSQKKMANGPTSRRIRRIMDREYAEDAIYLLELTAREERSFEAAARWRSLFNDRRQESAGRREPGRRPPRGRAPRRRRTS